MSVLRVRDVRLIVSAVGVSAVGDAMLWILLALHVGATGSPLAVSALFLCLWGPVVALGGVAGRLVDRHENRRLLILASLGQAAVVAAMALSLGSLPVLLGLCALLGAGVAISAPAEFALVPAAAGEEHVAAANGQVEAARGLGATAGPLLGGLLAAAGWVEAGLLLNAASFAVVALAAVALRARRAPSGARPPCASTAGAPCCSATGRSRSRSARRSSRCMFFTISVAAEVFFVADVLDAGPAVYGLLMTAWTLGMVGGAVGLARRVPRTAPCHRARSPASPRRAPVCSAPRSARRSCSRWPASLAGGLAHGAKNVLLRTLIHERVPEASRGRAYATYNALRNGAELGALSAGGVLVGLAGAQAALAVSGAIPLTIGLVALAVLARRAPARSGGPHMPSLEADRVATLAIDDLPSLYDGLIKLARSGLGITAFGVQVMDLPPDYTTQSHDEAGSGQQELYVGLRGHGLGPHATSSGCRSARARWCGSTPASAGGSRPAPTASGSSASAASPAGSTSRPSGRPSEPDPPSGGWAARRPREEARDHAHPARSGQLRPRDHRRVRGHPGAHDDRRVAQGARDRAQAPAPQASRRRASARRR